MGTPRVMYRVHCSVHEKREICDVRVVDVLCKYIMYVVIIFIINFFHVLFVHFKRRDNNNMIRLYNKTQLFKPHRDIVIRVFLKKKKLTLEQVVFFCSDE